jgi:HSP20 family protein
MSLLAKRDKGFFSPFGSIASDFFNDDFFTGEFFNRTSLPAVNVKESDAQFDLELAAPGFKKEEFSISTDNGILSISAETKSEKEESDEKYTRKEFNFSKFKRSFALPDNIDTEDVEAKYENGVLHVILKKKEINAAEPAKRIEVK